MNAKDVLGDAAPIYKMVVSWENRRAEEEELRRWEGVPEAPAPPTLRQLSLVAVNKLLNRVALIASFEPLQKPTRWRSLSPNYRVPETRIILHGRNRGPYTRGPYSEHELWESEKEWPMRSKSV